MKAIKETGVIDPQGHLIFDHPVQLESGCRVEVIVLIDDDSEVNDSDQEISNQEILENLRRSLDDAKAGRVRPISELWDGIDV
ncbi:MAG: hypothetical protein F6K30_25130 [Cyanothece sp. SIO2G6]|nr:hypothetical protein [Cyanothece sp. SIO2G6]